jgi:SAM-dependent methyltransferase
MKWLAKHTKDVASRLLLNQNIREFAQTLPFLQGIQYGLYRTHPFDKAYGVDTSGYFPAALIHSGDVKKDQIVSYIGSQPSVTRRAVSSLLDIGDYTFVDIGCGKGRVVIISSEFPFKNIVGLEISPALARIARSNAIKVQRRFPDRPQIQIITGNGLDNLPTNGKIVFYIYHAFGPALMSELIHKIESALLLTLEHVFIVYHNPVCGNLLDSSPALGRWNASTLAFQAGDIDHWGNQFDTVVIWQSIRGARPGSCPDANRPIVIVKPNTAALAPRAHTYS